MKTSKILKSEFYKPFGEGANLTYYHNVWFEGDERRYSIGAKKQNPDFLQPGQTLEWEWKDEAKGSIKKVNQRQGGFGGGPSADPKDIRVSTGLITAVNLYIAGKISKEQIVDKAVNIAKNTFDDVKSQLG